MFRGQNSTAEQRQTDHRRRRQVSGVRGFFEHLERKKYKLHVRVFLSRYRGYSMCSDCSGTRLAQRSAAGEDRRQEHLPGVPA